MFRDQQSKTNHRKKEMFRLQLRKAYWGTSKEKLLPTKAKKVLFSATTKKDLFQPPQILTYSSHNKERPIPATTK